MQKVYEGENVYSLPPKDKMANFKTRGVSDDIYDGHGDIMTKGSDNMDNIVVVTSDDDDHGVCIQKISIQIKQSEHEESVNVNGLSVMTPKSPDSESSVDSKSQSSVSKHKNEPTTPITPTFNLPKYQVTK